MVKDDQNISVEVSQKAKKKALIRSFMSVMIVVAIVILGYKLWENPKLIEQAKDMFFASDTKSDVYQQQIDVLQNRLNDMQMQLDGVIKKAENPDLSDINKRIDNIEQININTIKSKADVETVLGLIVRMDNAEGRLNDLAKVTNDSALVLTAAMLVKEAGERGGQFIYEAEVLTELAKGNYKIVEEINRLNEIAIVGVPSVSQLQEKFAEVYLAKYPELPVEEIADNWKDRIYNKLHKVIQIRKNTDNDADVEKFSEEDRAWSVIRDFVMKGEISKAISIAKKPLNEDILKNEGFNSWLDDAKSYNDFYESISRISANSLAVMKVSFLKSVK